MRWIVFIFPFFLFGAQLQENLKALQQIRSLVPERIWYEEFSILVDRVGFRKILCDHKSHKRGGGPVFGIACPQGYFIQSTFSGENVRILDLYQQFQFSPFWKTPPMRGKLESLERQILKINQAPRADRASAHIDSSEEMQMGLSEESTSSIGKDCEEVGESEHGQNLTEHGIE